MCERRFVLRIMSKEKFCLRCLLKDSGMEATLVSILEKTKRIPAKERAADEEYRRRLDICSACEWLEKGTCLKCGCYPELRAAYKALRCPGKKW